MRILHAIIVAVVLLCASQSAKASCDSSFGKHLTPPAPVLAPLIDDLPFARFEWGTDASMDTYEHWWGLNVIKNDTSGLPLVVNWDKAGIFIPLPTPLQKGEVHCRNVILGVGQKEMPVLDRNAPIVYSGNRHQDAAVYVDNARSPPFPNGSRAEPSPEKRSESAAATIETSYQDDDRGLRHVRVEVSSTGLLGKFEIFLYKNPEDLIVGISNLTDALDTSQLETIRRVTKEQGFSVEQSTLSEFGGDEIVKQLFWSTEAAIPRGDVLFFVHGSKGVFTYTASALTRAQRRQAIIVILDQNRRPIAADRIALVVPEPSK
jgi:hypothetical protein